MFLVKNFIFRALGDIVNFLLYLGNVLQMFLCFCVPPLLVLGEFARSLVGLLSLVLALLTGNRCRSSLITLPRLRVAFRARLLQDGRTSDFGMID